MYPTIEEVKNADHLQICKWYRFLPSADNDNWDAQDLIYNRFHEGGGMTPEISKKIGWD